MDNDVLKQYLVRLKEIDEQLSDADNLEVMSELYNILNTVTSEMSVTPTKNRVNPTISFVNTSKNPNISFAHKGDSGFDLRANIDEVTIYPGERKLIPTGVFLEIEEGYEIQVRPRSGLALKHGITVLNTPGTIDSHYRGEVQVILMNMSDVPFKVSFGDRIAQGVLCPVYGEGRVSLKEVELLNKTERNEKGFGSSGVQ